MFAICLAKTGSVLGDVISETIHLVLIKVFYSSLGIRNEKRGGRDYRCRHLKQYM